MKGGVGAKEVRYVPRNQGNQTFLAGYPRILLGYPRGLEKFEEKSLFVLNFGSLMTHLEATNFIALSVKSPKIQHVKLSPKQLKQSFRCLVGVGTSWPKSACSKPPEPFCSVTSMPAYNGLLFQPNTPEL